MTHDEFNATVRLARVRHPGVRLRELRFGYEDGQRLRSFQVVSPDGFRSTVCAKPHEAWADAGRSGASGFIARIVSNVWKLASLAMPEVKRKITGKHQSHPYKRPATPKRLKRNRGDSADRLNRYVLDNLAVYDGSIRKRRKHARKAA